MKTLIQIWKTSLMITLMVTSVTFFAQTERETVFSEDFEGGWGSWSADNGVWDVGIPIVGPPSTHSGAICAGTILDGNYPDYANTILISPPISLPTPSVEETIQLKFWQWFSIENGDDQGFVQISVNSGEWETISSVEIDGGNPAWSQYVADLTSYAGSSIRIGFYITSDNYMTHSGWYIDDVSIETEVVTFPDPEDFESGVGNWSADNGLWEVGEPPFDPHSGSNCAGTVLDGDYANYANTRLISPEVILTPIFGQSPMLFFYHRFYIEYDDDKGFVQLSVDGGEWQMVSGPITGTNDAWSQHGVNLADYADSIIRIAFYFVSDNYMTHSGWYIDDIRIDGIITGVDESQNLTSNDNMLCQNHPNPFAHQTKIQYSILNDENVQLSIYNINGELVKIIVNERQKRGNYSVTWQGKNEHNNRLSPGIYFYELKTEKNLIRKKMLLLK